MYCTTRKEQYHRTVAIVDSMSNLFFEDPAPEDLRRTVHVCSGSGEIEGSTRDLLFGAYPTASTSCFCVSTSHRNNKNRQRKQRNRSDSYRRLRTKYCTYKMESQSSTVMSCERMIERRRSRINTLLGWRRQQWVLVRIFLASRSTLLVLLTIMSCSSVLLTSTAAEVAAGTSTTRTLLDVSYQPHLKASTIVQALCQTFDSRNKGDAHATILRIDVSNSQLGDEGLRELAQRILASPPLPVVPKDDNNTMTTNTTVTVELKAQMNRLTGLGVATFLNHLLLQRDNNTTNENSTTAPSPSSQRTTFIRTLDFGWNRLHHDTDHKSNKAFYKALQELLASSSSSCSAALETLCLERTGLGPAACRAMAKGIMARFEKKTVATARNTTNTPTTTTNTSQQQLQTQQQQQQQQQQRRRLSLYLSGNAIGDSGVAALAAAIRTVCNQRRQVNDSSSSSSSSSKNIGIFDTLDLSACDIGDAGAEALALALEDLDDDADDDENSSSNCPPVCRLILSNNRITDQGALSLGRAFRRSSGKLHLVLDNNNKITDQGISSIVDAVANGKLTDVSLCSCSIHADGAELVGKALRKFALQSGTKSKTTSVNIDLSGNPLGILRGKTKTEGSKYSASRIKSKASATASAYMNHGLNFLKKGMGPSTVESDDEEEKKEKGPSSEDGGADSSKKRCGFKALANAFIREEEDGKKAAEKEYDPSQSRTIHLGLRRTFCDTAGADALAAMLVAAKDDLDARVDVQLDLALNPVLEEEAIDALHGSDDDHLRDMAERHTEAMEVIRKAQERAAEARRIMVARRKAEAASDQHWDDAPEELYDDVDDDDEKYDHDEQPYDDEEWDSDADYENEDEY